MATKLFFFLAVFTILVTTFKSVELAGTTNQISEEDFKKTLNSNYEIKVVFRRQDHSYEQRDRVSNELLVEHTKALTILKNWSINNVELNCGSITVQELKKIAEAISKTKIKKFTLSNPSNYQSSPFENVKFPNIEKFRLVLNDQYDLVDVYFNMKIDLKAIKELEIVDYSHSYVEQSIYMHMYPRVAFATIPNLSVLILDIKKVTYSDSLIENLLKLKNLTTFGIITIKSSQLYDSLICTKQLPNVKTYYARYEINGSLTSDMSDTLKAKYNNAKSFNCNDKIFTITCK